MFKKQSSFSNEIMSGMKSHLAATKVENKYSFDKVAKAVDLLNTAADIFDDAGFKSESESITSLLESIAAKQTHKKTAEEHDKMLTLQDLKPAEIKYFGQLPDYTKESLSKMVKHKDDAKGLDEFVREIKILHEIKKPEIVEMESVRDPLKQDGDWEEVSEAELMAKDHLGKKKV